MMKWISLASIIVLLATASVGRCELIEVGFNGQIRFVGDEVYFAETGVIPVEGIVAVGDSFSGIVRYYSLAQDRDESDYSGLYEYDITPNGISVKTDTITFMTNPESVDLSVFVSHDGRPVVPRDVWGVYSLNNLPILGGDVPVDSINLGAAANYGKLTDDSLLTTADQFAGWYHMELRVYGTGTERALYFDGYITSMYLVPEPATIGLLGVGGLTLLSRRKPQSFGKN